MAGIEASYRAHRAFGPFHRLNRPNGDKIVADVLGSGELGGGAPFGSDIPAVKAYAGELPPGSEGFEFFTTAVPDRPNGPTVRWRQRDDGSVRSEGDEVRIKVLISRVDQEIRWPP